MLRVSGYGFRVHGVGFRGTDGTVAGPYKSIFAYRDIIVYKHRLFEKMGPRVKESGIQEKGFRVHYGFKVSRIMIVALGTLHSRGRTITVTQRGTILFSSRTHHMSVQRSIICASAQKLSQQTGGDKWRKQVLQLQRLGRATRKK